jgi:opacity protein-like surface antigen
MKLFLAAAAFGLAALSLPAIAADCAIEKATYTQPNAEGFSLTFRPAAEPNAWSDLEATLKTPTREFKFSMTASNGYSFNYLVPSWKGAPEDTDFHVFLYGQDFASLELPNKGKPAPVAILAPELGAFLYYTEAMNVQEYIPPEMWRMTKCD